MRFAALIPSSMARVCVPVMLIAGLSACAPAKPTMSIEQAETYCRAQVSKPVDTRVHLGVGIGSGGKVRTNSGVQIGVNVDSLLSPAATYEKCVQRNSGAPPSTPYN